MDAKVINDYFRFWEVTKVLFRMSDYSEFGKFKLFGTLDINRREATTDR